MPIMQERINVDAMYAQPHAARLMGVTANYLAGLIRAGVVKAKVREPMRPSSRPNRRPTPRVFVEGREIVKYNQSLPDKPPEGGMPRKPPPPERPKRTRTVSPEALLRGTEEW